MLDHIDWRRLGIPPETVGKYPVRVDMKGMTNVTTTLESPTTATTVETKYGVIDTDVHPGFNLLVPEVLKHVPKRWHDYIAKFGLTRSQGPNAGSGRTRR